MSTTPVADALALVDAAQGNDIESDRRLVALSFTDAETARELAALRELAEAVRAALLAFSEGDVRALAVTAGELYRNDYKGTSEEYLSERQFEVLGRARELFGDGS
jgi:hypothetical protein